MRAALTGVYSATAVISLLIGITLLRRRQVSGGTWLGLMILSAGFWALCDALEIQVSSIEAKRLVSQLQYLGVVTAAPFYFHASLALARLERRLPRSLLSLVWSIPVLTLAVAWTSQWHRWLWTEITIPDPSTNLGVYEYGWWFWVFALHSYVLLATATGILLRAARHVTRPFRAPLAAVSLAVILPWVGNLA